MRLQNILFTIDNFQKTKYKDRGPWPKDGDIVPILKTQLMS